jgi:hypothetical protein
LFVTLIFYISSNCRIDRIINPPNPSSPPKMAVNKNMDDIPAPGPVPTNTPNEF